MTHCLSLSCLKTSSTGNTDFSGKRYCRVPVEIFIPIPSGYYFTSPAKMTFDIAKKTYPSAILESWACPLLCLSVLHSFCGLLGVITCMPTHILSSNTSSQIQLCFIVPSVQRIDFIDL